MVTVTAQWMVNDYKTYSLRHFWHNINLLHWHCRKRIVWIRLYSISSTFKTPPVAVVVLVRVRWWVTCWSNWRCFIVSLIPVFFYTGCTDPETAETTRQAPDAVHEVQQKGTSISLKWSGHPLLAISVNVLPLACSENFASRQVDFRRTCLYAQIVTKFYKNNRNVEI